ncbi:Diacylglycerol kinase 7 [Camellia lanceoleosa]|uniref:Diacylglycerol kinase 7 n=1 Tax=Camellia lanceoleosa TaxID=1840588 RepID=A0ACC0FS77_9ERIC|nr:Diacylglycerol kinase 7 [Camellia lanceoleosa]
MRDAIQSKDVAAGNHHYASAGEAAQPPYLALVVLINSLSGGRHGPKLKARVQELMGEEQVAGGDSTVGWVLGSPGELHKQGREPVRQQRIIPLGTGNDLSRSFGWHSAYAYLSARMDAQIAYGFHHLRNEKPYLAQGPFANKLIYSGYGCKQGWFFTPCISAPSSRGLKNILRMYVKKVNCSEWEQVSLPSSVKSIVALNLNNYASGRNPWDNLKPEYLE